MTSFRRKLLIAVISCAGVVVAGVLAMGLSHWPGIYENYSEPPQHTFRGLLKNRGAATIGRLLFLACLAGAAIVAAWQRRRQRKLDEYISRKRP